MVELFFSSVHGETLFFHPIFKLFFQPMVKLVRLDLGGNLLQVINQWYQHENDQCRFYRYHSNRCGSFHDRYHPHYIKNNNHTWRQNQELEGSSLSSLPMLATLYLDGNRVRTMMWWRSSGSVDGCDPNVARYFRNKILEPQNGKTRSWRSLYSKSSFPVPWNCPINVMFPLPAVQLPPKRWHWSLLPPALPGSSSLSNQFPGSHPPQLG